MSDQLIAENTIFTASAALAIVGLLAWRLKPAAFRSLSWQTIGIASALFWGLLAALLASYAWSFYYSLFAPSWYRFAAPLGAIVIYAALGIAFRWAALRLWGNQVVWFCLLSGYVIYWGLALALAVGIDRVLRLLHKEKPLSIG
jgi:hypothetical protein